MSEPRTQLFPNAAQYPSVNDLLNHVELNPDHNLLSQIYRILWNLIVTVRLWPGQLMSEKEISESLRASKPPVREALIRIEEAGLVEVVPKSGTYVTPIRINTSIDACFIRLQLEAKAVSAQPRCTAIGAAKRYCRKTN
ncbi:MAG: DNA-binding GntR family transcriptional regulator [Granulosicoccus sp.]